MTEEELAKWRARAQATSQALDRELIQNQERIIDAKAQEEKLAKTDPIAWLRQLVLKHKFQASIGVPSDFEAECGKAANRNNVVFFQTAAKALTQIIEGDARYHSLILKTMLEVYHDLRAERHRQFLKDAETLYSRELLWLAQFNPIAYKQLRAFARDSPQINIEAVLKRLSPVPAHLKARLAFLNESSLHRQRLGCQQKKKFAARPSNAC